MLLNAVLNSSILPGHFLQQPQFSGNLKFKNIEIRIFCKNRRLDVHGADNLARAVLCSAGKLNDEI